MSITSVSPSRPASSGGIPVVDLERVQSVSNRHLQLVEFLREQNLDGLLIRQPENFAWLTGGGDNSLQGNARDPVASVLVTDAARVVLCNNIDSGQLFDRELMGLGFLLKERPWTEPGEVLQQDVCRGRVIGSDSVISGVETKLVDLRPLRTTLEPFEIRQLRELGREVAHAVEATARNFEPGATEAEIAGHLAHRLIKRQIEPVQMQVMADAQGWRYRHWSYGADSIERHCVLSAIGRRHGLHVGACRTVSIGAPSEELQHVHGLATLIQATGMYFSRPDWTMQETWKRVARIYEKFEVPDEWRCAEQGHLLGYSSRESPILPNSQQTFQSGMAIFWYPSVRSSLVGDTMLVNQEGSEILTSTQNWPVVSVKVKDATIELPSLLIRECAP
ncbi:MAG TPA: M24 family metallopeptidase [Planctomicrobium sp.]|nr:M24 family metallopeptidase [Planctomicrobium sp.]